MNFNGTGVAIITPFKSDGSVDFQALEKLIEFQIQGAIDYLVVLGTTGETPTLSNEEKKDIITFVVEKVSGRIPIVVGAGGNNTAAVVHEMESFPLDGIAAILSASPYYNKPSQEGIFSHYQYIAHHAPKPVILYNVPGRTGRNMQASTIVRIAHEIPNVIGIKEASGDLHQCMQILKDKPADFFVVSGDDNLALAQIACGMQGVISVAANAFPKDFSDLVRASLSGDFKEARAINNKLLPAYDLMFEENNPAGIKAFLSEMGMIENVLRLPLVPLSSSVHVRIKKYLASQN